MAVTYSQNGVIVKQDATWLANDNRLYADYSTNTDKGCFTPSFNLADAHIIEENIVFKASKWTYNTNFTLCGGQWYSGTTSKFIGIAVYCYADQIEFDWGDNVSAHYDIVTGIPYDFSKIIRKNIVYDKNSGVATCKIYYDDVLVYTYTRATSDLYLWNDSSYSLLSNREHILVEAGYIDLDKSYIRIDGKLVWGVDNLKKDEAVIGGKTYRTVQMPDGKIWLAENLDFKFCQVGGSFNYSHPLAYYYDNDETTYGWNGYKCGLLYNGYACNLLESNKNDLIPGWHIPSKLEWESLITACGGSSVAGTKLKSIDENWFSGWNGTDDYGFKLLPAGAVFNSKFSNIGEVDYVNTSTDYNSSQIYYASFNTTSQVSMDYYSKGHGHSLRLVRDAT